ncbi:MAG: alpha-keto acid decarboxylase family protein [Candidatus Bathyarchaeia archaeon]|jgi:pyruvate decarboxylase/indolepyruvate decarboxylase
MTALDVCQNKIHVLEEELAKSKQVFTIGHYLAERFEQIGLRHVFMVPGDYNLVLLDQLLENKNLRQIGCCNELNAAYAAEGYARANGCGAVVTTFNVGAFSALNGVAGAYAENLPVIFVSGGFNTNDPAENHLIHHSIGTHDFSYQHDMFRQVTCAAVRILNAENAPALIDHAITTALRERKPAYIEIPCNLAAEPSNSPAPFDLTLTKRITNPFALKAAVEKAAYQISKAKKPLLLAGSHLRSFGAIDAFRELAEALGCAVAVMLDAKSFFPEDHPQFVGVYLGAESSADCEPVVDWSDLIIAGGPQFTDYTTEGWTALPSRQKMIKAELGFVQFSDSEYTGIEMADFFSALAKKVKKNDATLLEYHRLCGKEKTSSSFLSESDSPLTRAEMVSQIENDLDENTTLLVETGDAWFNGLYMRLTKGAKFEIEMQWGSIGWAVPASFGYAVGMPPGGRVVSIIGDGSFQLTAQEVANMIRYKTKNLIFLINNGGYVIESEIHEGPYNYFKNWDYKGLISTFNADDGKGLGLKATTSSELAKAIKQARDHDGPVLIECKIPHDDCTPQLLKWGTKVATANNRPPLK